MARGDMGFDTLAFVDEAEILNRKEFQAIPNTINFTNVSATDDKGRKIVKAGTPVTNAGVPVTATPWTNAVGIILHDVTEDAPQVAVLKVGYINITRAQAHSGLTYDAKLPYALIMAGCDIKFEAGANGAVLIASAS